ncbi:MAG: glycoside hydrolase family 32 protein [Bacteroidota bacterium]|nr:glycoside hydrolase family 32 protein [Bacteroidota bacterium]
MLYLKKKLLSIFCLINLFVLKVRAQEVYHEQYRLQIHFSPKEHWVNDPNGMVFYDSIYHLFFQYYPGGTTWGPMHWGHATSTDLIHWQEQPVALYPDSLGYIFSGSAVVDKHNTSGLGANGKVPLVAIYTSHDPVGEKAGRNDYQNQSIAYSLDNGRTWEKFSANPVLKNPGITDFRDPKVMWYKPGKKWVMTLATKDRITFFSSPDLKNWKKESEFGVGIGAHGGVWECPDLFSLDYNGKKIWVLVVNLNPGGPNKGSATQYFLGDFDGNKFTPLDTETKWLDYGPDEYAGITWSNTGDRKIFIGWMSNWMYASKVPSSKWRNAMTIPRELHLKKIKKELYVASNPVYDLKKIEIHTDSVTDKVILKKIDITSFIKTGITLPCRLDLNLKDLNDLSIIVSNDSGEKLIIGYEKKLNHYFIDRTLSGKVDFNEGFAAKRAAPRLSKTANMDFSIILDESSVELFADNGLSVMTEIFFPENPYNKIEIEPNKKVSFKKIQYTSLKSIWK